MEIPDFVVDRATFFAIRYSNMNNEEEIRDFVTALIKQKMLGIQCFGGEVVWKSPEEL
ncbi:MAG: hypothetical protein ACXACW_15665 [Candidatus Hodarchaeales archaeon]|jgi:hypothetical protein